MRGIWLECSCIGCGEQFQCVHSKLQEAFAHLCGPLVWGFVHVCRWISVAGSPLFLASFARALHTIGVAEICLTHWLHLRR